MSARGYFATPISDNLEETPEGYLIARDTVIARTGEQEYLVKDLPQESARDMGVDTTNPAAAIDLFRAPEDVFNADTLASAEGKPVTDGHPSAGFVTPENFPEFAQGHIQNVRRGREQLDSGDWPMIADVIITAEPLLSKVKSGQCRELSLGYDYGIEKRGDQIHQVEMIINHCACVPKGRAGPEARIYDAAQDSTAVSKPCEVALTTHPAPPEPAALPPEPSAGHAAVNDNALQPKKEQPKVKNNILHIFGLGLKAKAADADTNPEDLAEMAMDVGKKMRDGEVTTEPEQQTIADKRKARDRRAKDIDFDNVTPQQFNEAAENYALRKGASTATAKAFVRWLERNDPGDGKSFGPLWNKFEPKTTAKDEEEDEPEGGEVTMTQDRRRMHDRLDEMLDGMGKGRAKDADISALRDLINDYLAEEEEEPEHMEDADPSELEEALGAGEEPDAEDAEACPCGEPGCPGCEAGAADIEADPGEKLEPSGEEEPVEDRKRAADAARTRPRAMATDAARNSVKAALRMIRPHVARVGDENLSNAFNVALRTVAKPSRASSGGYGAFAGAAAVRNARTPKAPVNFARAADAVAAAAKGENEKTQKLYDTLKKGGTK